MPEACSLLAIERTRQSPSAAPKRRYRCSCGEVGRWTTSAGAALAFWRTHAGVTVRVVPRGR